jgi:hypothetical protein
MKEDPDLQEERAQVPSTSRSDAPTLGYGTTSKAASGRSIAAITTSSITLLSILTTLFLWDAPPRYEHIIIIVACAWLLGIPVSLLLTITAPKQTRSDRRLRQIAFGMIAVVLLLFAMMQM